MKNDIPRPRHTCQETKDFRGVGNRVFGRIGLATTGWSTGNGVLAERKSSLRKVSTIAQVSLEAPNRDSISPGFPTMRASRIRRLSAKGSAVMALGCAGYDRQETAHLPRTSVPVVRNRFWREIREVRWRLRADEFWIISNLHIRGRSTSGRFCGGLGGEHASQ